MGDGMQVGSERLMVLGKLHAKSDDGFEEGGCLPIAVEM